MVQTGGQGRLTLPEALTLPGSAWSCFCVHWHEPSLQCLCLFYSASCHTTTYNNTKEVASVFKVLCVIKIGNQVSYWFQDWSWNVNQFMLLVYECSVHSCNCIQLIEPIKILRSHSGLFYFCNIWWQCCVLLTTIHFNIKKTLWICL